MTREGSTYVRYNPLKPFKLSKAEVTKYEEISADVAAKKKDKKLDSKAASARIEAVVAKLGETEEEATVDVSKDPEFVGFMLTGVAGGGEMSGGDIEVDLDDVEVEEPREAEEKEAEKEDERSLWGDGDNDPADVEEEE